MQLSQSCSWGVFHPCSSGLSLLMKWAASIYYVNDWKINSCTTCPLIACLFICMPGQSQFLYWGWNVGLSQHQGQGAIKDAFKGRSLHSTFTWRMQRDPTPTSTARGTLSECSLTCGSNIVSGVPLPPGTALSKTIHSAGKRLKDVAAHSSNKTNAACALITIYSKVTPLFNLADQKFPNIFH